MASTKEAVAPAAGLSAGGQELCSGSEDLIQESRTSMEDTPMLFRDSQQQRPSTARPPQPAPSTSAKTIRPARRNKLAFKNRWLISVDIIAALRRAGVDCDIVLPPLYVDTPDLTRH